MPTRDNLSEGEPSSTDRKRALSNTTIAVAIAAICATASVATQHRDANKCANKANSLIADAYSRGVEVGLRNQSSPATVTSTVTVTESCPTETPLWDKPAGSSDGQVVSVENSQLDHEQIPSKFRRSSGN